MTERSLLELTIRILLATILVMAGISSFVVGSELLFLRTNKRRGFILFTLGWMTVAIGIMIALGIVVP